MLPQFIMAALVVKFDGGILDGVVDPFHLTIGPRMVGISESMLDAVFATYMVEAMDTVTRGPASTIFGQIGKLDAPSAACLRQSLRTGLLVRIVCGAWRERLPIALRGTTLRWAGRPVHVVARMQTWRFGRWRRTGGACLPRCVPRRCRCGNSRFSKS